LIEYECHEFLSAWYGFYERQRIERLKTFLLISPHLEERSSLTPEKLWSLHGDVSNERTKEETERLINIAKEKWV
jgi:hypothetical protein